MQKVKVLFLAANPLGISSVNLEEEIRSITKKIRESDRRDQIELILCLAARPGDLIQALNQHKPQVVHFSGHGSPTGEILLVGNTGSARPIPPSTLQRLFKAFQDSVRVVVLNACHMSVPTETIKETVDCVIGTRDNLDDQAAITFATWFYSAIGFGRSVRVAFEQAKLVLEMDSGLDPNALELMSRTGIDPATVVLTDEYEGARNSHPYNQAVITSPDLLCTTGHGLDLQYGDDIVLLVGAGASNYLGLATLDGLVQQTIFGNDSVATRIKNTCNSIQAHTRHASAQFEELISQLRYYLDVAETLWRDSTFKNELGGNMPSTVDTGDLYFKWKATLTRCYRTLLEEFGPRRVDPSSEAFKTVLKLLGELAAKNSGRLHVYTTNYDCSFQVLASNCQDLVFYTHIDNENGSFMDRWYKVNRELNEHERPSIYIHRFHGCVGWFADPSRPFGLEEVFGTGGNLDIEDDNKLFDMKIKLTSSQPIGTDPAFSLAFQEFCEHLNHVKVLLVWGYSFRDSEILRYITLACSQRPGLSILYIDPYVTEVKARQRIISTMKNAPIPVDMSFRPRRIDWKPSDGHNELVQKVIKSVNETLGGLA